MTPNKCLNELGKYFLEKDIGRIGIYDFVISKNKFPDDDEIGGHHHMGVHVWVMVMIYMMLSIKI